MTNPGDPRDENAYYSSGRHLWRVVIWRAQQEASGEYLIVPERKHKKFPKWHARRLREAAAHWLTTDTPFLRRVLSMSGLDITIEDFLAKERRKYGDVLGARRPGK